jgi:hypothetical protein
MYIYICVCTYIRVCIYIYTYLSNHSEVVSLLMMARGPKGKQTVNVCVHTHTDCFMHTKKYSIHTKYTNTMNIHVLYAVCVYRHVFECVYTYT